MSDAKTDASVTDHVEASCATGLGDVVDREQGPAARHPRSRLSMHEGVPDWVDTCCCEPETRWRRLAEQADGSEPALVEAAKRLER
jgi:hypothetical protein